MHGIEHVVVVVAVVVVVVSVVVVAVVIVVVVVVVGACRTVALMAKPTTAGLHLAPLWLHPRNCYLTFATLPAGFATLIPLRTD